MSLLSYSYSFRFFDVMIVRAITSRVSLFVFAFALCVPMALGQMPQQGGGELLSSEDVSDEELRKVARIVVSAQIATQEEQMAMKKEMMAKQQEMQEMDSTEQAQARREMRKQQMKMQKRMQKVLQKEAAKEDMKPQQVQLIMQSAQQDQELGRRLQKIAKKVQKQQMQQQGNQGGGPPNQ